MKKSLFNFTVIFLIIFFTSANIILAQQLLKGENYKIVIPSISPGGDFLVTDNYEILATLGQAFSDPRLYSESYKIAPNNFLFEPNIPQIACFETTTNGASGCTTGPAFLNEFGMVRVCGPNGCYDRARFEIDTNDNPSDTLYGIQISTDGFIEDMKYIDGTTLKSKNTRTIDDYKTKNDWETSVFNLLGLQSETGYSLRITALYADLTESAPGPIASATTALAQMSFQIGLDYEAGENINYNPPLEILFSNASRLIRGAPVVSAEKLIWTLINSNSLGGITVVQKGKYGGLYNSTGEGYTIGSISGNLDATSEGIGIQNHTLSELYSVESENGLLGSMAVEAVYQTEGNNVGLIDTVFRRIYTSNAPIHTGQTSLKIKTKVSLTAQEGEYSEDITIVLIAKY